MKKIIIYSDYFKKTFLVWILLILCIYCVLACEFESLRCDALAINKDKIYVNKVNNILKNLSFSYIAGVIFFFLSDTIPFLRRKRIAYRNVEKSLQLMIDAINDFSVSINGQTWDENSDVKRIFEDMSGGEYAEDMPMMELTENKLNTCNKLLNKLSTYLDFVISQELYVERQLINEMESIKTNDCFCLLISLSNYKHISPERLIDIFGMIINTKITIKKYL